MTVEEFAEETQKIEPKMVDESEPKSVEDEEEEEKKRVLLVEKSASYREESNFLSDLKEAERKALTELKSKLEDAISGNKLFRAKEKKEEEKQEPSKDDPENEEHDEEISLWGVPLQPSKGSETTDVILLKFLRARDFKVNESFEMLKRTLLWRQQNNIDSILDEDLGSDLSSFAFMDGIDHEGHPVCYNIFGVFGDENMYQKAFGDDEKREAFMRWRVQFMEKGIKRLELRPGGVSSILQINDLKNCPGPYKKEIRSATLKAIELLQDNYPELVVKNIFINVPFWYYAFYSLISPFFTQRSKSKFVVARPSKLTDTLLKYIPMVEIPTKYGGFKRENDIEFCNEDAAVSELVLKPSSTTTIEIPAPDVGASIVWDITVIGWEVSYKEEFVPTDDASYTIIIHKSKKFDSDSVQGSVRNSFKINEPGKIILTVDNSSKKKKRAFYRYKTQKSISSA